MITLHAGGTFGDRRAAFDRLRRNGLRLSRAARDRLALENDDRRWAPTELTGFCRNLGLPFVYDVHHHRCLPDELTEREAAALALATWRDQEPVFHTSSPRGGWGGATPHLHADSIDPGDVPAGWECLAITLEVEAKAKEEAVRRLARDLKRRRAGKHSPKGARG